MPIATIRRHAYAGAILVLGPLAPFFLSGSARADRVPPTVAIRSPSASASASAPATVDERRPVAPRGATVKRGSKGPESSSAWWLGTGGIALALAACGGLSVASKRYLPARAGSSPMRVIGRTSLSPKHTVYLLEVGERVLIVGAGAQGAPSLLGELTDPAEREAFVTTKPAAPSVSVPLKHGPPTGRFDRRVGDDE